jgi:hypothetical protein
MPMRLVVALTRSDHQSTNIIADIEVGVEVVIATCLPRSRRIDTTASAVEAGAEMVSVDTSILRLAELQATETRVRMEMHLREIGLGYSGLPMYPTFSIIPNSFIFIISASTSLLLISILAFVITEFLSLESCIIHPTAK